MENISECEFDDVEAKMRAVMLAAGVRKQDHAKTLAPIIGTSVPQAYKKLNKRSELALSHVKAFNRFYGVRLISTPLAALQSPAERKETKVHRAVLRVGGTEVSCTVEVGLQGLGEHYAKKYAAYRASGAWFVEAIGDCPVEGRYQIEKLNITLGTVEPKILVLDDEKPFTDLFCDYLAKKGFSAAGFYELNAAKAAIRRFRFDGFFLDWRLGDETSEKLIESIRGLQPEAPIIVSTAGDDDVPERRAIFDALAARYRVQCHIKPTPMKLLTSLMAEALEKKENSE